MSTNDLTLTLLNKLNALENYVHPDFHQIAEVELLTEALEAKADAPGEGYGFSQENFSLPEKEAIVDHSERIGTLEGNSCIVKTWTAPATAANQIVTLDTDFYQIIDVHGSVGHPDWEPTLNPNEIEIVPELDAGEVLKIVYWTGAGSNSQSYPKAVIDSKISELRAAQQGGYLSFTTLALLQAYATPDVKDGYKVSNDGKSSNNGYYHWVSGTNYVKDFDLAIGAIGANNSDAVPGGDIFNALSPLSEKTRDISESPDDGNFYITDASGNIIAKFSQEGIGTNKYNLYDSNGTLVGFFDKNIYDKILESGSINEGFAMAGNYLDSFYVTDGIGDKPNIGLKYDENGLDAAKLSAHFKSLLLATTSTTTIESNFKDDLVMNIIYGQSLGVGGSTISAEDFYTSKMFSTGVMVLSSYTDVAEANNETTQEPRFGEITDMDSIGNGLNGRMISKKINELIASENGKDLETFNHNEFGFVAGLSGAQWYQLSKWNEARTSQWVDVQAGVMPTALEFGAGDEGKAYLNLMQGIYFANKFANAQGKTLNVATLSYVQGEASGDKYNDIATYKNKLTMLFDDISADVKLITGQSNDVQFITYQNSSFAQYNDPARPEYEAGVYTEGVPLASLEISRERADTHFGTVLYPYSRTIDFVSDLTHLDNKGYALMSSLFGIQAKRVINDNNGYNAIYPIEAEIQIWQSGADYFTKVPFEIPIKPLVFDVDGDDGNNMKGHGLQPNYGFSILNGSDAEIITNVRLSSDNAVVITCNEDPTALDLTYAITGVMGGGNLRDSQGETITTEFNGETYRCDNWCPFFRITI